MEQQHYRILVVDDEPQIREIVVELLSSEGYICTEASDGEEATKQIEENKFDLLVTDFRMPNMDGSELINWCRENKYHFPVIFITGNPELLPKEQFALGDCCADLLSKPLAVVELFKAINSARVRNHHWMCHRPDKVGQD